MPPMTRTNEVGASGAGAAVSGRGVRSLTGGGAGETSVRPVLPSEREWVRALTIAEWGAEIVVVHGRVYRPDELPGFWAESGGERSGLLTYEIRDRACEIVTLNALRRGRGIGTALVLAVREEAVRSGCRRLWLVTTNDNLEALRFYQRRGFVLAALRRNAVEASRRRKPQIPLVGAHGIPIRDEIELESTLGPVS